MSFIYAEKNLFCDNAETVKTISILSDTKILFTRNFGDWSDITRKYIELYGMVKSIILCPTCCVSFAGNNIFYVTKLLDDVSQKSNWDEKYLCEKAFEIHSNAPPNDIEFIICYIKNKEHHIVCIKEGKIEYDCVNSWIGSPETFLEMQKHRMNLLNNKSSNSTCSAMDLFRKAIRDTKDGSVGKDFFVHTFASSRTNKFIYPYRIESFIDVKKTILSGENIPLMVSATEGGFTSEYLENTENVIINIPQADLSILYTKQYRLDKYDVGNPSTKYFLLPITYQTSSGKILIYK